MHKKAHDEVSFEKRGNLLITRGLRIKSRKLGMTGQCDVVEFHQTNDGINVFGYDGTWDVVPVEYKNGEPKEGEEDELQLCAQAVCLEEMFQTQIEKGYLFYGKNKHRTEVIFSNSLRQHLVEICVEMHHLFQKGYTPKVKTTPKCRSCSLNEVCVPKLEKISSVKKYIDSYINGSEET